MVEEYQLRLLPEEAYSEDTIRQYLSQEKGFDVAAIRAVRVVKRSIDARHRRVLVNLKVRAYINELPAEEPFTPTDYPDVSDQPSAIVVGAGPGGLFAALRLIEMGVRPIVLERGKSVEKRKRDLATIPHTQTIDPESNYCFGEGGAGAFSDGKLYTRSKKRGSVEKILNVFCQHGASAAILMLVFKDTIMGLVAGVQLSAYDMLRPGDWISMPKYGADGIVQEVTLNTVKVQNWDNTITTIPPYALVSDSFQNWRGMRESGGRRIKRSLHIDMNSIRFCTADEMDYFAAQGWISEAEKAGGQIVNLHVFCHYIERYLRSLQEVNTGMTLMVRQLQPLPEGLPVELYFFTTHKDWIPYERLQAKVFEHLFAVIGTFGLRVYQKPSSLDLERMNRSI